MTQDMSRIKQIKIIIIDDDEVYSNSLKFRAMSMGYQADIALNLQEAIAKIQEAADCKMPFTIAIVDMKFQISRIEQRLGKEIIKYLKDFHPSIACILSSADPPSTIELQDLINDYKLDYCLPKHDIDQDTLSKAIERALKHVASNKPVGEPVSTEEPNIPKQQQSFPPEIKSEAPRKEGPPKVFISYAHKDEILKDELVTMLAGLQRTNVIELWQDRQIEPGEEWYDTIQAALQECDIAVLLVSGFFLASRFIQDKELPGLLERRKLAGLRVIPIIVRNCLWQSEPVLSRLQALPKNGRPVNTFSRRDQAWAEIAKAIENIALNMT